MRLLVLITTLNEAGWVMLFTKTFTFYDTFKECQSCSLNPVLSVKEEFESVFTWSFDKASL